MEVIPAKEMSAAAVYAYLNPRTPADCAVGAVPSTAVRKYTGALDEKGQFHGHGVLHSTMGFCYEGHFVHGTMKGHGVMTWTNGITYTGDFAANAPSGRGVLRWSNGDRYTGDVSRGVRHGEGELVTSRGTYVGAWARGQRHGVGRQTYADGAVYDGAWAHNRREGVGRLLYAGGDCYDGEWLAGERHGNGAMGWAHRPSPAATAKARRVGSGRGYVEVYEGEWRRGVPHGLGRSTYIGYAAPEDPAASSATSGRADGPQPALDMGGVSPSSSSSGPFAAVSPAAFAPPPSAVVNLYDGHFVKGLRHGYGVFYYADGGAYEGEWCAGAKLGRGRITTSDGVSYYESLPDEARRPVTGGPASGLPSLPLPELLGAADGSLASAAAGMRLLLLRHNSALRELFLAYAARRDGVALATTPVDWWRRRLPARLCVPQLLRLLSDAGVVGGAVGVAEVMACVGAVAARAAAGDGAVGGAWSAAPAEHVMALARLEGAVDYREFVESLVRLAGRVCVGAAAVGVGAAFAALLDGPLARGGLRGAPLFPATRRAEKAVRGRLDAMRRAFDALRRSDALPAEKAGFAMPLLSARRLAAFLRPFLARHGVGATAGVGAVMPFDHFETDGTVPPGVCQPRGELGRRLYAQSRGDNGELTAERVADERRLTFVEFIEALVLAAEMVREGEDTDKGLDEILEEA